MKIPNNYKPFQINSGLCYEEIKPSPTLSNFIAFFWKIENKSNNFLQYQIIPDGTVDLVADLFGYSQLKVSISQPIPLELPIPPHNTVWGIRLYPAVFTAIFGIPMTELQSFYWVDFEDLLPQSTAFLSEELAFYTNLTYKKNIFEYFLIHFLENKKIKIDNRLFNILEYIYKNNGNIAIEKNKLLCISPRQLRRLFNEYIGFSPKTFSNVVRMQNTVQSLQNHNFSFYDMGFYDQAHFIREVKKFTNYNPTLLKHFLEK